MDICELPKPKLEVAGLWKNGHNCNCQQPQRGYLLRASLCPGQRILLHPCERHYSSLWVTEPLGNLSKYEVEEELGPWIPSWLLPRV